jgi:hypothetical protein
MIISKYLIENYPPSNPENTSKFSDFKSKLLRYAPAALTGLLGGALLHSIINNIGEDRYNNARLAAKEKEQEDVHRRLSEVRDKQFKTWIGMYALQDKPSLFLSLSYYLGDVFNTISHSNNPDKVMAKLIDLRNFFEKLSAHDAANWIDQTIKKHFDENGKLKDPEGFWNEIAPFITRLRELTLEKAREEQENLLKRYNELDKQYQKLKKIEDFLTKEYDKLRKFKLNESNNSQSAFIDRYIQFLKEESRRSI